MVEMPAPSEPPEIVEIRRIDATGYSEIMWSDGRCLRFSKFRERSHQPVGAAERDARRRHKRRRKINRRNNGEEFKAVLEKHGLLARP
jgi:hypothetical protein